MPSGKRRVYVALYHRDQESLGVRRQTNGTGAYHWAILVVPKEESGRVGWAFDVTNGAKLSHTIPAQDLNPSRQFYYRSRSDVDRTASSALLCISMIGKLDPGVTFDQINDLLRRLPAPRHEAHLGESCVTWTEAAIRSLSENGFAERIPIPSIMNSCLNLADEQMDWLQNSSGRWQQGIQNLTGRPS